MKYLVHSCGRHRIRSPGGTVYSTEDFITVAKTVVTSVFVITHYGRKYCSISSLNGISLSAMVDCD